MIYNNPVTYGVDVSIEGMKDTGQKKTTSFQSKKRLKTRAELLSYSANLAIDSSFLAVSMISHLESLMLGATGWISGLTNVFPKRVRSDFQS